MNRLHHLKQTLQESINNSQDDVEFVVLDYGSTDGLEEWIYNDMQSHINTGKLKFKRTDKPKYFRPPHAKNIAHKMGNGAILVNLDADNIVTKEYMQKLREVFNGGYNFMASKSEPKHWNGAFGRIAIKRWWFYHMGGYNEEFEGYGYEDDDLIMRARAIGIKFYWQPTDILKWIDHGDEDRYGNIENQDRSMMDRNMNISLNNIEAGQLVANAGKDWGV